VLAIKSGKILFWKDFIYKIYKICGKNEGTDEMYAWLSSGRSLSVGKCVIA